jgi:uncharacterized membrane protein
LPYILTYIATALAFLAIDAVWLSQMGERLYKPLIGPLLAEKVDFSAAILFYLIYIGGIMALAILPTFRTGGGVGKAALAGAMLGFVAYATYDLTNGATLKMWSWKITFADMAWGTFITGVAAAVGYMVLTRLKA